jgi:hypothetical protein
VGAHLESDTLGPLRELLHVGVADRGLLRRHVLRDGCPWENSFRETQARVRYLSFPAGWGGGGPHNHRPQREGGTLYCRAYLVGGVSR